jgi:hypothetical protein
MPTISRASSTPSPRWPGCYKLQVIQLHSRTEQLPNITARLAWHLASGAATGIARAPHLNMGNLNGLPSHELRYIEAFSLCTYIILFKHIEREKIQIK